MIDERILTMNFPHKDVFYRESEESGAGGAGMSKESVSSAPAAYFGGRKKRRGSGKRKKYDMLTKKINTLNSKVLSLKTQIRNTPNPEDKDEMEFTIDHLLRNNVFIDLFKLVKQSFCIGSTGYGLKDIEPIFRNERTEAVTGGTESMIQYELWSANNDETKDETDKNFNEVSSFIL